MVREWQVANAFPAIDVQFGNEAVVKEEQNQNAPYPISMQEGKDILVRSEHI